MPKETQENKDSNLKSLEEEKNELLEIEEALMTSNPELFEGIPADKKLELLQTLSLISIQHNSHSGPLPDSQTLIEYNSVIPNGADRIMKMAEKQQSHRMEMENKVISSQSNQSKLGQLFGLIMGLAGICSGTYLTAIGQPTVGGIIAGATVVSLVSIFVIGKNIQKKQDRD